MSIEEIKEKIIPIAKEYGVGKVALFGSITTNENTAESDIDILIDKIEKKDFFVFGSFANDIEDALGRSVDILTYKGIQNSIFKDSILEKEVVIYGT